MDGIEVLYKIVEKGVESPVFMISGQGILDTAIEANKKGAYDFIEKSLDLNRLQPKKSNCRLKQSFKTPYKPHL